MVGKAISQTATSFFHTHTPFFNARYHARVLMVIYLFFTRIYSHDTRQLSWNTVGVFDGRKGPVYIYLYIYPKQSC